MEQDLRMELVEREIVVEFVTKSFLSIPFLPKFKWASSFSQDHRSKNSHKSQTENLSTLLAASKMEAKKRKMIVLEIHEILPKPIFLDVFHIFSVLN